MPRWFRESQAPSCAVAVELATRLNVSLTREQLVSFSYDRLALSLALTHAHANQQIMDAMLSPHDGTGVGLDVDVVARIVSDLLAHAPQTASASVGARIGGGSGVTFEEIARRQQLAAINAAFDDNAAHDSDDDAPINDDNDDDDDDDEIRVALPSRKK